MLRAACRLPRACCVLRAACRLPRACCIQPKVARCVLPLAACVLYTVARYVLQGACRLPCAWCRLHAACCALRDAGALPYSTWYHEHNCMMQICMGTERNGQVGRTYWQAAMRYKVCHVLHVVHCREMHAHVVRCRELHSACRVRAVASRPGLTG